MDEAARRYWEEREQEGEQLQAVTVAVSRPYPKMFWEHTYHSKPEGESR